MLKAAPFLRFFDGISIRILSPRLDPGDGVSGPFIDLISEAEVEGGTDGLL